MSKPKRYSAEVRERAVRMVREHEREHEHSSQWATNRGGQYLSIRYTERLAEAGIAPSVGGVGDS